MRSIKQATRKQYSYEEKIWIVLDGLRGEDSISSQYGVFYARVIRFSDGTTGVYGGANIGTDNLEYPPADDVKLGYQAQMIGINMKYHALWQTHDFYVSKKPKLWQIMGSFLAILVSTFLILYGGLSIEFRFFCINIEPGNWPHSWDIGNDFLQSYSGREKTSRYFL